MNTKQSAFFQKVFKSVNKFASTIRQLTNLFPGGKSPPNHPVNLRFVRKIQPMFPLLCFSLFSLFSVLFFYDLIDFFRVGQWKNLNLTNIHFPQPSPPKLTSSTRPTNTKGVLLCPQTLSQSRRTRLRRAFTEATNETVNYAKTVFETSLYLLLHPLLLLLFYLKSYKKNVVFKPKVQPNMFYLSHTPTSLL